MSESTEAAERWRSGTRPSRPRRSKTERRARRVHVAVPPPVSEVLADDELLTPAARDVGRRGLASLREALAGAVDGSTECVGS